MNDYTLVLGVDARHLQQLSIVWPTWRRHKPSLVRQPTVIFYDREEVTPLDISKVLGDTCSSGTTLVSWPPEGVTYPQGTTRWDNQQRYKMLAGFVHVPPAFVKTTYWLKIDTDVVATGNDDWIDPHWFSGHPAIVSQRWGYTKPADQMDRLDEWSQRIESDDFPFLLPPLRLHPRPNANSVAHKRIISWCAFFRTEATTSAASYAEHNCGLGLLPVPSQDGYLWYFCARQGWPVVRTQMKSRGWKHRNSMASIRDAATEALYGQPNPTT